MMGGSAAALFLSVVVVVGVGGAFATSGALALFGSDGGAPQQLAPAAAPTEAPTVAIEPIPSPVPTPLAIEPTPSPLPTPVATPFVVERAQSDREEGTKRETPEPKEREQTKKVKRETPEPKERERDERDAEAEREKDD